MTTLPLLPTELHRVAKFRERRLKDVGKSWLTKRNRRKLKRSLHSREGFKVIQRHPYWCQQNELLS